MASSSDPQNTPKPNLSLAFRSEKPLINSWLRAADHDPLSTKTPEKPQHIRQKTLREPTRKQPKALIDSAGRKIESLSEETPNTLPEKYEILGGFFDGLDASIRLLRLRGLMPSFTNICPKIECLTDRRFTYSHLAQLKFVLPEVIEIKKVLANDEKTCCTKSDLHVTLNIDAFEDVDQLKSEGCGHMHLRRVFRERLADIIKSHPVGYDIPEETLPQPFNCTKEDMHPNTKFLLSSAKVFTYVHTVERPETLTTHPVPSNQSKEDLNSTIVGIPDLSLPSNTSSEAPIGQQPAITTHLPLYFRRHFSQPSFQARDVSVLDNQSNEDWNSSISGNPNPSLEASIEQPLAITTHLSQSFQRHFSQPSFQSRNVSVPESNPNIACSIEEASTATPLYGQVPATPTKEIVPVENDDGLPTKSASIQSTPAKLASTPARLMTLTPALHPPKRWYMSPDDNSTSAPENLARRPPRSRSLKFDTPVKNKKVQDEVFGIDGASIDNGFSDVLPEDLLQSLKDKEGKAREGENPAISQAKRQQQMISSLPKLFNTIHFLSQSRNCSAITKEELVHKIIWTNCDVVDRKEVEEQLTLLLELVPEWISEKNLASEGDLLLIYINKMSHPDAIRARLELEEAK